MLVVTRRELGLGVERDVELDLITVAAGPASIVGVTSDITEQRAAEQNLLYAATHDAMTGLLNRAALPVPFAAWQATHTVP